VPVGVKRAFSIRNAPVACCLRPCCLVLPPTRPPVRQGSVAGTQLGATLALFGAVRTGVDHATGSPLAASLLGGAVAVAASNVCVPSRRAWHAAYYGVAFGAKSGVVGVATVAALSGLSGAVVLGGADAALRSGLGLRW